MTAFTVKKTGALGIVVDKCGSDYVVMMTAEKITAPLHTVLVSQQWLETGARVMSECDAAYVSRVFVEHAMVYGADAEVLGYLETVVADSPAYLKQIRATSTAMQEKAAGKIKKG